MSDQTIVGFVGNGVRKLVERSIVAAGGPQTLPLLDRALATFLDHYREHLLDTTVLYPGVAKTVRALSEHGVVLSVATNKPEAMARAIVDGLGIADAFCEVLGGDSVPAHKPDPAIVHALARRAGIAARDTLLVGDSPVDVATARAAGVAVCAVTWGLTAAGALRAAAPDRLIDRPEELLQLAT